MLAELSSDSDDETSQDTKEELVNKTSIVFKFFLMYIFKVKII